ncbi:hypothetical protein VTN96DRAFT_3983 [Rasamsonia emersonii]
MALYSTMVRMAITNLILQQHSSRRKAILVSALQDLQPRCHRHPPSVFDDPETAKHYQPRADWENLHRFDPSARWTWGEEYAIIRKIDLRIFIFACLMFMALELDRANIAQALTDNFLEDLHMNTNDYNWGNTVFKLSFLCAELPSQLVSKWMGPDRWIPTQMVLWSLMGAGQFWLSSRTSFLVCRVLLGLIQGGFIPDMILYLSYFYKHGELSVRLGFWWTAMNIADIIASFLGFGLLHLRGHLGYAGWRWLFLIEGLITMAFGLSAYVLMPPGPTQTANWSRGKNGWFTEREEIIMVNRIIREDPSKSSMHNRQPITPKLLWQSMSDLISGFSTPSQYLTLSLKGLGFGTFTTNLLVIPSVVGSIITMVTFTYLAEIVGNLAIFGLLAQLWALPFLIYLYVVDINTVNKWTAFGHDRAARLPEHARHPGGLELAELELGAQPNRQRGAVQHGLRQPPLPPRQPRFVSLCVVNIFIYIFAKLYYILRNRYRDRKWNAMTPEQREEYLRTTTDRGNKRLDFRFAH